MRDKEKSKEPMALSYKQSLEILSVIYGTRNKGLSIFLKQMNGGPKHYANYIGKRGRIIEVKPHLSQDKINIQSLKQINNSSIYHQKNQTEIAKRVKDNNLRRLGLEIGSVRTVKCCLHSLPLSTYSLYV